MASEPTLAASDKPAATAPTAQQPAHGPQAGRFAPLVLGSIGVVFGDIGTSPLYAFHDALTEVPADRLSDGDILGVLA